jgi:hypothetical protein
MKKRLLLLATAFVLLGATYTTWRSLRPAHRITPTIHQQIRAGMSQQEVEAILGVPPGDYSGESNRTTIWMDTSSFPPGWRCETWRSPSTAVAVWFDGDGRVLILGVGNIGTEPSWFKRWFSW